MKRKILFLSVVLVLMVAMVALCACSSISNILDTVKNSTSTDTTTPVDTTVPDATTNTGSSEQAVTDDSITATETTEEFSITTEDGTYSQEGTTYTITAAGTYVLSGYLNGQILVDADDAEVVLELSGVTIENSTDSPIKIVAADSVDISAKKNTENVIKDTRANKTVDTDTLGEGAIYSKADLKIKGAGVLVITATYNNGIHCTKDLTIQKLSLKVTAYNNAIKGNDSVKITSGTIVAISTNGDGIKSENTDANKKGVTRGDITITGNASVTIYAAGDGIQSAHNFTMSEDEEGNSPYITIYTGTYSGYTASNTDVDSFKGIKVENILTISGGTVDIKSYDDGLHANYGTVFDTGETGLGTINIAGGLVNIVVYSPTTQTQGGRMGPGRPTGPQMQQSVTGADAIHADYTLNIVGGIINIDSSYEGLEANIINISGGESYVKANDDGVNAKSGIATPQVNITGGYLDVTVSPNGDTDGIDSNGTYTQSGGIVITRGPNSEMSAALDADGNKTITGGTLIILGYGNVSRGSGVSTYSLSLNSTGNHTITIDGTQYTFNNSYSYGRTTVYSSVSVSA